MNDVFENHLISKNHIDTKINWLLGISGLIMSLLFPYILNNQISISHFGLFVMGLSAFATFLICLLSLELPYSFVSHRNEEDSVMYYNRGRFRSSEDIFLELKKIQNYDDVLKQYSITLYNLVERNMKVKNRLFKMASKTLLTGLIIGVILIIIGFF